MDKTNQGCANFKNVLTTFTVPQGEIFCSFCVNFFISRLSNPSSLKFLDKHFRTLPSAPTIIGFTMNFYSGYIICILRTKGPLLFNFSSIFFDILVSTGQLISTMLQVFCSLFHITISGLLWGSFVVV